MVPTVVLFIFYSAVVPIKQGDFGQFLKIFLHISKGDFGQFLKIFLHISSILFQTLPFPNVQ